MPHHDERSVSDAMKIGPNRPHGTLAGACALAPSKTASWAYARPRKPLSFARLRVIWGRSAQPLLALAGLRFVSRTLRPVGKANRITASTREIQKYGRWIPINLFVPPPRSTWGGGVCASAPRDRAGDVEQD